MKWLSIILALVVLTTATGCQSGKWRLRGAKCRPGMSMPTYTQPPAQSPGAPCNPGYPPTGYMPPGYLAPGYVGPGYTQSGDMQGGNMMTGNVVVQEFPTTPIDESTQILQRPYISSPVTETPDEGAVITVPGPEQGPMPHN
jgi:hypothetical protein